MTPHILTIDKITMLLVLILSLTWTLSAMGVHSTSAYRTTGLYRSDLTEKARQAVAEVLASHARSRKLEEPLESQLTDMLDFLLDGSIRDDILEKDLRNLRRVLKLMESSKTHEATRHAEDLEMRQPEVDAGVEAYVKRSQPATLRRRSCYLRLGGHCATESLDQAMRQKQYLSSFNSPGRKRRSLRSMLTNQISANQ